MRALSADLGAETVSEHDTIERYRRLAVVCPSCGTRATGPVPEAAKGTPSGPRLHAVATYLKTFQAFSYQRLQAAFADLFGVHISQSV